MDQRSRLLNGTERLQDGSRRLEEARRVALETGTIKTPFSEPRILLGPFFGPRILLCILPFLI
jgi:hypothetical protein